MELLIHYTDITLCITINLTALALIDMNYYYQYSLVLT